MNHGMNLENISENKAVALLTERLSLACGYNYTEAKTIGWAAKYHDIGKAFLPQELLLKPDKLLPYEFEIIKQHTKYGEMILSSIPGWRGKLASQVALLHHEWFNGKGYWGYPASRLPPFIGAVSLCDVYVALASDRAYKKGWMPDDIADYIRSHADTQFCPHLVELFLSGVCECTWLNNSRDPG